jgi:phthalate 4,5-cis-dihydrodiol dehydrogenase
VSARRLRLGVAGLGRAFTLMLPAFTRHPRVELAAAADPRPEARSRFATEFRARAHESVEALCADEGVDAIYVATPHQCHAEHAVMAARHGKHVLVEKPMALTLDEADRMVAAASDAGVRLVVGPSHSFDAPIAHARALIAGGRFGAVRMITALDYTDFLYRPRRPEELDTALGGGVVFSQAAHHVDVVRLLGGGRLASVRAMTGSWEPQRPTEGAYSALLAFAGGAFATITYSGYGRYDSDELCENVGELGHSKDPADYGRARRALALALATRSEAEAKSARNYGGSAYGEPPVEPPWHEHFGFVVVSCERADLRPTPKGVWIFEDEGKRFEPLARPAVPRAEVIDELCDAIDSGRDGLHRGEWGRATLEACLAILRSAREGRDIPLDRQVPA